MAKIDLELLKIYIDLKKKILKESIVYTAISFLCGIARKQSNYTNQ